MGRADDESMLGRHRGAPACLGGDDFRDTEVQDLGERTIGRLHHEDVLGFDVAVQDALVVDRPKATKHAHRDRDSVLDGEGPTVHACEEVAALAVLHDHEGHTLMKAEVGGVHHVRVADGSGETRLAQEPARQLDAFVAVRVEQLDRDRALQARVGCLPHFPHSASTDAGL